MTDNQKVELLLVEDEPNDVELTLRALRSITNRVHVARDGAEALDYFFSGPDAPGLSGPPKVILLDLNLPLVSGVEVLERLRADERTKAIPVVVLTSSEEERDIARTYHLGVNSYVTKPVEFAEFTQAIQHLGMYWLILNKRPNHDSAPAWSGRPLQLNGDSPESAADLPGGSEHPLHQRVAEAVQRTETLRDRLIQTAYAIYSEAADLAALLEQRGDLVSMPAEIDYPTDTKRWRAIAELAGQMAQRWERRSDLTP